MKEQTFALIKPDAVRAGVTGKIIDRIEQEGFDILRLQKGQLSKEMAEMFYAVHKDKPFFNELTEFISSGPVVIMALEKDNAVKAWRDIMGATNPADADQGTLRKQFAKSISENVVHGSDSLENAAFELSLFFAPPQQQQQPAQ